MKSEAVIKRSEIQPMASDTQSTKRAAGYWILDGKRDLMLIVGTPFLILPAMILARSQWADVSIVLFVAAFGQLGHNLPGMMRAYGDRALFCRYRLRFIVAPIALVLLCILGATYHFHGLILISVVWAVWHALMQTHGFARIYDAKAAAFDDYTRWLDFAVTLSWFGGALVLCDQPTKLLLAHLYNSGGPTVPAELLSAVRLVWLIAMIGSALLFALNVATRCVRRLPVNPIKVVLLAVSVGFYWYAYAGAQNILVGAAMFEIFHDIQYLTIVWVFNRKRAAADPGSGAFTRFLFGRSGALLGLYLGLICAFGGLRYVEQALTPGRTANLLTGFILAMGLLHYYYDGFIWKVREAHTRQALDLSNQRTGPQAVFGTTWFAHSAKWALFVVPLALFALSQWQARVGELARLGSLAASLPDDVGVLFDYGRSLEQNRSWQLAADQYRRAIVNAEDFAPAHLRLGIILRSQGELKRSQRHLIRAVELLPYDASARVHLSRTLVARNKLDDAEYQLRRAVEFSPAAKPARTNLGIVLVLAKKYAAAETQFRQVLKTHADDAQAHYNLGNVLREQGKFREAARHFRKALEVNPRLAEAARQLKGLPAES